MFISFLLLLLLPLKTNSYFLPNLNKNKLSGRLTIEGGESGENGRESFTESDRLSDGIRGFFVRDLLRTSYIVDHYLAIGTLKKERKKGEEGASSSRSSSGVVVPVRLGH
jgi:hypothetical protein